MKPIVFNFNDSLLDKKGEAIGLKAGYLLADEICSAGNTTGRIYIKRNLSSCSISEKMAMIEKKFSDRPDLLTTIQGTWKIVKIFNKTKHKTPHIITQQKEGERIINNFWLYTLEEVEKAMNEYGFEALRCLEEDIFRSYLINLSSETAYPGYATVSNLMQRLLPDIKEDEEPEIFFLGSEFFTNDFKEPCLYMADNKATLDVKNTCLYRCFTLPDFTTLRADELKRLRKHFHQAGAVFRENMNEWIDMCYFGDEVMDRIRFFTNELLPAATALQEYINGNETRMICPEADSNVERIEVWIGEMPVHDIWNYYRRYEVIKDCSWSKLQQLIEKGTYKDQRWPVMILNTPESLLSFPEEEEAPAEEIKASKKYILID